MKRALTTPGNGRDPRQTESKKSRRKALPGPAGASNLLLELANNSLVGRLQKRVLELERKNRESSEKTGRALRHLTNSLAEMLELTDPFSAEHQRKVARLAGRIAARLKLSRERIEGLVIAGTIHDIGKIAVPAEILSRPGKLNELEMGLIRNHSEVAFRILKDIDFPWPIAKAVFQHHERMDGSGYPQGLKGKDIIIEARILAVSDVIEAMSSHRPYRPALGIPRALEEISVNAGILYDPAVVQACLDVFRREKFVLDESSTPASPPAGADPGVRGVMAFSES